LVFCAIVSDIRLASAREAAWLVETDALDAFRLTAGREGEAMTDIQALLLEAADRLDSMGRRLIHWNDRLVCSICDGKSEESGNEIGHKPSCIVTRLRTAAASIAEAGRMSRAQPEAAGTARACAPNTMLDDRFGKCPTCGNQLVLNMWSRPCGPPGNGWGKCSVCFPPAPEPSKEG
jgi:hypothetical protein